MAIRQANTVENNASESAAAAEVQTEKTTKVDPVVEKDPVAVVEKTESPAAEEPAAEPAAEDRSAASEAVLDEVVDEEPEPAAEPVKETTAVAEKTGTTAVSTSRVQGAFLQSILQDLQAEGFEDTQLDYSSFLNITLNKVIETSEGQELPSTGFLVRLANARTKYCFRNNNPVEDEVEVAYSYDRNDDKVEGSVVHKAITKWREEGLELGDVKEYKEVLAVMIDDAFNVDTEQKGELNGKLITIQVAPTSQGRWGGFLTQLKLGGIKNISDAKVLVRRGKKVESGKFPFFPWDFVLKGRFEAEAEAAQ